VYAILVNLVPTCVKCGSPVTDLLEAEVEEQGQLKKGKYVKVSGYVTNVQMSKEGRVKMFNVKVW
jgi:hypothetical protein